MTSTPKPEQLEVPISRLLRIGGATSFVLVVIGFLLALTQQPQAVRGRVMSHWSQVLSGLTRGDGQAIIVLGLLVLIATPVLRVALSVVLLALQGDRRYTCITLLVLVLLLTSFLLGKAGG